MRFPAKMVAVFVAVVVIVSSSLYWYTLDEDGGNNGGYEGPLPPVGGMEVPFVLTFEDPNYIPAPPTYSLPLDLDGVNRLEEVGLAVPLTPVQLEFLISNGMVGTQLPETSFVKFYEAYEWIQETKVLPTFVTSDSMLDAYHLLFQKLLRDIEDEFLHDQLEFLCRRMMDLSDRQVEVLDEGDRHLAEENVVFFAVGLRLLDAQADVPSYAVDDVERIVGLINDASGVVRPPGFNHEEDLTQYIPRGHYTSSERLTRYFRAMMWYGRLTFRGCEVDETRRAVLASVALIGDEEASSAYLRIGSVLRFIMGSPDDLTPFEYAAVSDKASANGTIPLPELLGEETMDDIMEEIGMLRRPRILSDIAQPWDETWGLRLFGQAFVYDSYIFQRGVYDAVPDRFMPSGLDVMAVLGSDEAWSREPFDEFHSSFEGNLKDLRDDVGSWDDGNWGDNLYNAWLHSLQTLHQDIPAIDVPAFMGTDAWRAKQLNTQLASWTQLTHDTLLYRKQSYTYTYGTSPFTNFTYVEPVPELYSRLGDMVNATVMGLRALSMLSEEVEEKLIDFEVILGSLERVAVCELTGAEADQEDLKACRKAYEVTKWEVPDGNWPHAEGEFFEAKTVVVSDVHTDPKGQMCLEEGVGYVAFIVVVVPSEHGLVACVGPVFQHYEFTQPMSERLTDEEWKAMLEDGTAPEPAPWAKDFMP